MAAPVGISLLLTLLEPDSHRQDQVGEKIRALFEAINNQDPNAPVLINAQNALYNSLRLILANQVGNAALNSAIGRALESALNDRASDDPDIRDLRQHPVIHALHEQLKEDVERDL